MAESEGEFGYVLQQTVHNLTGGRRPVATLLTQVLVEANDPAFSEPTKPIGPRPFARGSIEQVFADNTHLQQVLPAMGYSQQQRSELKATIEACNPEVVINASPADIEGLLGLTLPVVRVSYTFCPREGVDILAAALQLLPDQNPAEMG